MTALRQYSGFDYITTFFTFVFFALPVFWVAVILKGLGGINFNDWLRDGAHFAPWFIVLWSGCSSPAWPTASPVAERVAGWPSPLVVGAVVHRDPDLHLRAPSGCSTPASARRGPGDLRRGIAYGVTAVMAGVRNRKALYSALTTAGHRGRRRGSRCRRCSTATAMNLWLLLGLAVVAVLVGVGVGYAFGGYDKGLSARTAAITALLVSIVVFVDRTMQSWQEYSENPVIRGRPIKTIGDREPRLEGSFWVITNDTFSHLILPTLALMLISVATYTRYSRASMLEVLNQDYIRTARAKGLTERTVIVRHGFRNAMIPLATVVAVDIGAILGGAVVTETVFEWNAMGRMFMRGPAEPSTRTR